MACLARLQGLCAASIAWGAWGGAGMAAGDAMVIARLLRVGVSVIQPAAGLAALSKIVSLSVAAGSGTIRAAGNVWSRLLTDGRQNKPFFADMKSSAAGQAAVAVGEAAEAAATDGSVVVAVRSGAGRQRSRRGKQPLQAAAAAADAALEPPSSPQPEWQRLPKPERTAYFSDEIAGLVQRAAGRVVGRDEPLLSAGLDSLGE